MAFLAADGAQAAETKVAVAANFTAPAKEIAALFEKASGHKAVLAFGSTGKLYTQILNGAPFEAFLAADAAHPEKAEAVGLAVAGSRFTYAVGRLALWTAKPSPPEAMLKAGAFAKLAIANPRTAPYGAAALEVLDKLGLKAAAEPRLVYGDNIAQTHQFAATGAADLAFVALAQVTLDGGGSTWVVPEALYSPIRQQALLLKESGEAAQAFLAFLKSPEALAILAKYGYGTGQAR